MKIINLPALFYKIYFQDFLNFNARISTIEFCVYFIPSLILTAILFYIAAYNSDIAVVQFMYAVTTNNLVLAPFLLLQISVLDIFMVYILYRLCIVTKLSIAKLICAYILFLIFICAYYYYISTTYHSYENNLLTTLALAHRGVLLMLIMPIWSALVGFSAIVRRLHDINLSARWGLLFILIHIILAVIFKNNIYYSLLASCALHIPLILVKGTSGPNKYGVSAVIN